MQTNGDDGNSNDDGEESDCDDGNDMDDVEMIGDAPDMDFEGNGVYLCVSLMTDNV